MTRPSRPRRPGPTPSAAVRGVLTEDTGSILPLVAGFVLLALGLVFVCVDATSLYLAQKRADAVADAAALAAADGFELIVVEGGAVARLTADDVRDQATAVVAALETGAVLTRAETPDGVSARVTVELAWVPPLLSFVAPDGLVLSATATSRTALR